MTFEQMERAMQFMLEQQARSLEHQAQTDAKFKETGEILNRVGLKLDILAADSVTFDAKLERLHGEIAAVRDVAISHNQAINQLFRLHEQTQQKFDRLHEQMIQKFNLLHEQRRDEFELNQRNFEILNQQREQDMEETRRKFELADEQRARDFKLMEEQRARDMEETRRKFELADEQRERDVKATLDLINQVTRKIDSLTDALTKPGQNGRQ